MTEDSKDRSTAVLDVRGLHWASEQNVVAAVLGRRPGVLDVEVNAVGQTATVVFDPRRTSLAELRGWVTECGYHCAGQSVPAHVCDPMLAPDPPGDEPAQHATTTTAVATPPEHVGHGAAAEEAVRSPHEGDGPRWTRRHVDGGDGHRHA